MAKVSLKFLGFAHTAIFATPERVLQAGEVCRVDEEEALALLEDYPDAFEEISASGKAAKGVKALEKALVKAEARALEAEGVANGHAADVEVLEGKLTEAEARIAELEREIVFIAGERAKESGERAAEVVAFRETIAALEARVVELSTAGDGDTSDEPTKEG